MRKLFIPLVMIFALVGCKKETTDSTLEGNIKGLGNDTIYIYSIDGSSEQVDTIVTTGNKFAYATQKDTLTTNILLFANGERFPVFIDKKEHIKISGNSEALQQLKVEGGETNADYARFLQQLHANDTVQATPQEVAEGFIRNNKTSRINTYLINNYFVRVANPNIAKIKELIELLPGILQDDQRIRDLNEMIEREEKMNIGRIVPFFSLNNEKGEKVTRNDQFKDQYLVLNFWASWDHSSKAANAAMRNLYRKFKNNKKVGILGISFDINKQTWLESIKNDTLKWEQVSDFNGMNSPLINTFAIRKLPANLLISNTGKILARDITTDSIASLIDQELKKDEALQKVKKGGSRK